MIFLKKINVTDVLWVVFPSIHDVCVLLFQNIPLRVEFCESIYMWFALSKSSRFTFIDLYPTRLLLRIP